MSVGNDAALIGRCIHPSELPKCIKEISNRLSSNDFKKLYFLCLDLISAKDSCPQQFEELLSFMNDDIDFVLLTKELLYHIKKYSLLKSLGTCRHQMKILLENRKYVIQGRLSLFSVCENLKNEDVKKLKLLLGENSEVTEGWEEVAAEDFFRIWFREINEIKFNLLKQALETMKYSHLIANLNYEESLYQVITPSCGRPCGLAVIFNNEVFNKPLTQTYMYKQHVANLNVRAGTRVDEEDLCKLWTSFGFDVVVFRDKTYPLMMEILELIVKLDCSKYSIFVCCILTHGDQGVLFTSDNIMVDLFNEVIYKFDGNAAVTLNNKPKMFFIQACQGSGKEIASPHTTSYLQTDSEANSGIVNNNKRDMLWALSAIPSRMSFRSIQHGSWFINSLVDVFKKYGDKQTVQELLNLVNVDVSKKFGKYTDKCNTYDVSQMSFTSVTTFRTLRLKKMENNPRLEIVRAQHQCSQILLPIYRFADIIYQV